MGLVGCPLMSFIIFAPKAWRHSHTILHGKTLQILPSFSEIYLFGQKEDLKSNFKNFFEILSIFRKITYFLGLLGGMGKLSAPRGLYNFCTIHMGTFRANRIHQKVANTLKLARNLFIWPKRRLKLNFKNFFDILSIF